MDSAALDFAGAASCGRDEVKAPLRAFERFDCVVVEWEHGHREVRAWMEAEHWLKSFRPVGHSLVQVIKEKGEAVEALLGQWREKYGYERKTLGHIVTLCDAANGVPVALAATTQIGGEQEASRRLLRRESTVLLNATVTADAPIRKTLISFAQKRAAITSSLSRAISPNWPPPPRRLSKPPPF